MEKETLTDREVLLLRRKLDLLLRTGKLLMESAADTNRIERNMKRVAAFMGIPEEKLHLDIRWTMIMVNVSDETHSFSKFQKCEKHGINMTTITEVSHLSWKAIEQDYSLDQYEEELERIARKPRNYMPYLVAIGAGFACGGFCKLLSLIHISEPTILIGLVGSEMCIRDRTGSRFCSLLFVHLSDSVSERVVSSSG